MNSQNRTYDLLAVGELLVDLIGHELADDLRQTRDFHRYQGGSPANMAANMARLGNRSALVACVGNDNLGVYLKDRVAEANVETQFIASNPTAPTSVVIVSRTKGTPDFIAYREADCWIKPEHLPDDLLKNAAIFHTTCFALSRQPAQDAIVDAARRANEAGCQVSIDANYAPAIWPDRELAQRVLQQYCSANALVKLSDDDAARLFGYRQKPEEIAAYFHGNGAPLVCLTLGAEGSFVSYENGRQRLRIPSRKIEVIDATGAGDAYWAGFLTAWLDGHDPASCARAGAHLAEKKLTRQGPLPGGMDKEELFG
ncbi:carbohydrate kinase family protein [Larkinella rosea]|uniref:Sugar kinase n=1 Tax=Larkinella rosea TaxID=2025312 RepID=A0A3P1B9B7_9BACT|nr:sugar kinase [Larkinella rosea]RRA97707.1 sugar kinase [Larkinella rosea]